MDGIIALGKLEQENVIEKITAYEIFYEEKSIMEVTVHDVMQKSKKSSSDTMYLNGYYAVRFPLSGDKKVFITGLTAANVEKTQKTLVKSYKAGKSLRLEDMDYIDAEKTEASHNDDNLCWAASCSNLLHYTGWGEQAGFEDADDLFDLFADSFVDGGSNTIYGYNWFFNGNRGFEEEYLSEDMADIKEYGSSGRYLPDYDANTVMEYIAIENDWTQIHTVLERMEAGYGIEAGVSWKEGGGHSVSCWGCVINEKYGTNNRKRYEALLISDSDSCEAQEEDRRTAPNTLEVITLKPYSDEMEGGTWVGQGWWNQDGVIDEFITLEPFSEEVRRENDTEATRDKIHTVDVHGCGFWCASGSPDIGEERVFYEGDRLYFSPLVENTADVAYTGTYSYVLTITDQEGNLICEEEKNEEVSLEPSKIYYFDHYAESPELSVGTYTVSYELNKGHRVPEAYYYNNSYQEEITIMEVPVDLSEVAFGIQLEKGSRGIEFGAENKEDNEAEIEEMLPVKLYYKGINKKILDQFDGAELQISYLMDKETEDWYFWDPVMTPEELALETGVQQEKKSVSQETARLELPDRCMVAPMGFQVRLRLVFTGREGMPNLYLISDSYDLYYQKAEISAGENNTDICTVLEQGASGLPDGEMMSFEVSNVSTFDGGTVEGYCYLMAYGGAGEAQKIRLTEDLPFSVGYGEKVSFSINSWDPQIELSGSYDIRVYMTAGKYETFRWLSRLKVRERQGLHVTIGEDEMDVYDGETSLREAIAWYMEGKCAGEAITFAEYLYEEGVSLDAPLLIDGGVVINGIRYLGEDGPFGIALEMENTVPGFEISEKGSLNNRENCRDYTNREILRST